jgi:hypothetical protein
LHRIEQETAQLSESLRRIGEFELAWKRGRMQLLQALEKARQQHEAAKAAPPPPRGAVRSRPSQRKRRAGVRS